MNPSKRWFPTTFTERVAWYRNFADQFTTIGPGLGFLPADIAQVQADAAMMEFLSEAVLRYETFLSSLRHFRKTVTEGPEGSREAQFPAVPNLLPPAGSTTGIYDRLIRLVSRIRAAPQFTGEVEALLGLRTSYSSRETSLPEAPEIGATAGAGSSVRIKFVRGAADGIDLEARFDNAEDWNHVGRFVVSPATITVPPSATGSPRYVELRARYLKGNASAGQYSNVAGVSTLP